MRNQNLGNIEVQATGHPKKLFPLPFDNNTTYNFGETQPLLFQAMIPGSSCSFGIENLVRLASMPVPTFGRMSLELRTQAVPIESLVKHFKDSFLSQTAVGEGDKTFIVEEMPSMRHSSLCAHILIGSRCTIYYRRLADEGGDTQYNLRALDSGNPANTATLTALLAELTSANYIAPGGNTQVDFGGYKGLGVVYPHVLFNVTGNRSPYFGIPVNANFENAFNSPAYPNAFLGRGTGLIASTPADLYASGAVALDSADYVVSRVRTNGDIVTFAFRLSNFGKRLRKIFIGCGYEIDFANHTRVSLLPIFAYFKAYFDSFGLQLYTNYYQTAAARLLTRNDFENAPNFEFETIPNANPEKWFATWREFIYDLGNTWATAPQDYISAHTASVAVSTPHDGSYEFIDVSGEPNISIAGQHEADDTGATNHDYINDVTHGYLDETYLKRMYRWTNRCTVEGKKVRELLISQGLGDFVERERTTFVGQDNIPIHVTEISATSDTFNAQDNTGSQLGEWAGKGVKYDESKKHFYETDEHCFLITIACLIPKGGYTQAHASHIHEVRKFDFYNPEFDSLGYDASTFADTVCGSRAVNMMHAQGDEPLTGTFGYRPRYQDKKFRPNIQNGDFSLRSVRDSYLPYTLDKIIDVGEISVAISPVDLSMFVYELFPVEKLPTAGLVWRYYYRYPWLSNFNRIFNNAGAQNTPLSFENPLPSFQDYEMNHREDENFLGHHVINLQYRAPMLPVSESYGTILDDENGKRRSEGKA